MLNPAPFKVTDPITQTSLNNFFDWLHNEELKAARSVVTNAPTPASPSLADLAGKTARPVEVKMAPGPSGSQAIVQKPPQPHQQEPVSTSSSFAKSAGIGGLRAAASAVSGIHSPAPISLFPTPSSTLLMSGSLGFAFHAAIGQHAVQDRVLLGTATRAQFAKLWNDPKKLDAAFEAGVALADGLKEHYPSGVAVAVPVIGICKDAYDAHRAVVEHDQVAMVSAVAGGAANVLELGIAFRLFGHYSAAALIGVVALRVGKEIYVMAVSE